MFEITIGLVGAVIGTVVGTSLADKWLPRTDDPVWQMITAINTFGVDVTIHPADHAGRCSITISKRSINETFTAATYAVALAQGLHWCEDISGGCKLA